MVNELAGNKKGIAYAVKRDWDGKVTPIYIKKTLKILGYSAYISFQDGLKQTHSWFVQNC